MIQDLVCECLKHLIYIPLASHSGCWDFTILPILEGIITYISRIFWLCSIFPFAGLDLDKSPLRCPSVPLFCLLIYHLKIFHVTPVKSPMSPAGPAVPPCYFPPFFCLISARPGVSTWATVTPLRQTGTPIPPHPRGSHKLGFPLPPRSCPSDHRAVAHPLSHPFTRSDDK